jgi:hypothetical protein
LEHAYRTLRNFSRDQRPGLPSCSPARWCCGDATLPPNPPRSQIRRRAALPASQQVPVSSPGHGQGHRWAGWTRSRSRRPWSCLGRDAHELHPRPRLTATLERLRVDRQLKEALTCGADPPCNSPPCSGPATPPPSSTRPSHASSWRSPPSNTTPPAPANPRTRTAHRARRPLSSCCGGAVKFKLTDPVNWLIHRGLCDGRRSSALRLSLRAAASERSSPRCSRRTCSALRDARWRAAVRVLLRVIAGAGLCGLRGGLFVLGAGFACESSRRLMPPRRPGAPASSSACPRCRAPGGVPSQAASLAFRRRAGQTMAGWLLAVGWRGRG